MVQVEQSARFAVIVIRQGIGVFAFAVAGVVVGAVAIAIAGTGSVAGAIAVTVAGAGAGAGAIAVTVAGAVAGAIAVTVAGGLAGIVTGVIAVIVAVAGAGAKTVTVAIAGTVVGALAGTGTVINTYVAWQAMKGDEKYALIRSTAVAFTTIKGTSFRNADLTDANFTSARLKSTDLRGTKLTRTCFKQTKLLDRVRPGTSYLQHPQVQQLIVTGQGQDKNFDYLPLRGINLQGGNLVGTSFIGVDLSEANLQDSDLSRAKLKQTQLDGTDFTGATLTGAYIEDWGITNETNFRGVKCKYMYMRIPTKENPDPWRKPDNREEVFADGEFRDFIKSLVDTLDLYHNQGVDPRAIAISFKRLAENHPDAELRITGVEVRGENEDKVLLRTRTSQEADKSQLSAEYFEIYNHVKALAQQEVKVLMAEKDDRIRSLETMVVTALKSPNFYAQGDTKMSGDNIQQQGSFGIGVNKEEIKAENIAGTINEAQQQTLAETAAEIQELLEQLEKSYLTETTTGKMALAAEVMARIENNPTLTARILSALKVGSVKAFEQFLSHPAASFVIGALEDWEKTPGS